MLEASGMALGPLVTAVAEGSGDPTGEPFTAMLDTVLANLLDCAGFDIAWGLLTVADLGGRSVRCLLGPALADRAAEEFVGALDEILTALAAEAGDGGAPARLRLTDLGADERTAPLAVDAGSGPGLRLLLGVPLLSCQSGRVVGSLAVGARDPALGSPEILRLVGAAGWLLGTAIDVATAQRRLHQREERAQLVTRQSTDAIYILDEQDRFTYLNPQVERLTGFSPAELLGRHFSTLIAPASLPGSLEMLRRIEAGEAVPPHHEIDIQRREGALRTVEVNLNSLYEHDRFIGRFGIARDVTERRQLESELARRNRALEALNAIATLAGRSPDLALVLDQALDQSLAVFDLERGGIFLLDEARNELTLAAWRGFGPAFARLLERVPASAEIPARVLAADGPVLGHQLLADLTAPAPTGALDAEDRRAYACIALCSQQRALGVLCVVGRDQRPLSPTDSETLAMLGAQLGVAIENARLTAESAAQRASLEAKTAQLSELLAISAGFAANVPPEALLDTVARAIGSTLGFGSAHVRTLDAHGAMVGVGFYGHDEAQIAALRQPTPADFYTRLLDERFRLGGAYYIPHAVDRLHQFGSDWTVVRRQTPPNWQPGQWHPEDALVMPLHARDGTLVGVIYVDEPLDGRVPGREAVAVLELFARQAALAVENAGLYRALQERLSQVEGISAVGTALIEEHNLERVLHTVGEQVISLLDAAGCSIALLEPDEAARVPGEELSLVVVLGRGEELRGERLPLVGSFSGEAIRRGEPVLSEDAQNDPRGFAPTVRQAGIGAVLAVPLQTSERTVGALNVHDPPEGRFGPGDIEIITLFAQQAAVAIENARLYEQERELAVAEERNRMAREIHDTLAQGFTGIILQLELARSLLDDPPAAGERLLRAQNLARSSLDEARRSVWNLRPSLLQGRSLGEALLAFLDEWSGMTGVAATCAVTGTPRPLTAEVEGTLFRIAQEALNNTYKHAGAGQATVELSFTPDMVRLRVCDDGAGFTSPRSRADGSGFGLVSMRERASRIGGTFAIESTPRQGTCIEVLAPDGSLPPAAPTTPAPSMDRRAGRGRGHGANQLAGLAGDAPGGP